MLATAVTQEGQEVYYYQGLHDIGSVLLFATETQGAASLLATLALTHLRDFTRYLNAPHMPSVPEGLH